MKKGNKGLILRVAISLGAIVAILYTLRGKLSEAFEILRHDVEWSWFLVAAVTYLVSILVITCRIKIIFKAQNILLKYTETFYLTFMGLFFNFFFPSAVGGDVAKAYYAYKHSGKKMESMTSVILDRLMGFIALITMAVLAVLLNDEFADARVRKIIFIFVGVMLLCVFFFASRRFAKIFGFLKHLIPSQKIKEKISSLYHSIYSFKKFPGVLLGAIFYSVLAQVCFILMHYLVTRSLNVDLGLGVFFILVPVFCIVTMAPSLGGLGVREAGMIYFFSKFMPSERALAVSVLVDILIYGFSILAGIVYSLKGGLKMKAVDEMKSMDSSTMESENGAEKSIA